MIYLDNSATSFPKPMSVNNAVSQAMKIYGANPGRSGHTMSKKSGLEIERTRKTVADFFGAHDIKNVAFTLNCTQAINMVIKGILKSGDHVIVSNLEHNAVMRPIRKLQKINYIDYTVAEVYPEDFDRTVDSFRNSINSKTSLIICTHASNVLGIRLPIERIAAMAKIYEIPILVDAAQSAGLLPINIKNMGIDYLCVAGHKALYGPMGTGMLITHSADKLDTIIEGGTGTNSLTFCHPKEMPQKFESGTPNMSGISGLRAGIEFVNKTKIQNIFNHEINLMSYLYDNLKQIKNIELYTSRPNHNFFVPVLSFNIKNYSSDEIGKILNNNNIEVRTGLHCAPTAHKYINTLERGTVRISPSVFNNKQEINKLINILKNIK